MMQVLACRIETCIHIMYAYIHTCIFTYINTYHTYIYASRDINTQDGDLLSSFLELNASMQHEILASAGVKTDPAVLCELIDALNEYTAGE